MDEETVESVAVGRCLTNPALEDRHAVEAQREAVLVQELDTVGQVKCVVWYVEPGHGDTVVGPAVAVVCAQRP